MRLVLIALLLFVYWLVLSGHYETWLIAFGAVLSVVVVVFCWSKRMTDAEGFPIGLMPRGLVYWPWLIWQIVLSALRVTKLILDPKLPISPTLVKVNAQQQTSVGLVTYANSITLTPGTISIEASEKGNAIWVHAIERESAEGFEDDEMNRKVAWFEKGPA
jgi:multicomponent Na+:H+ antiporter subunit E